MKAYSLMCPDVSFQHWESLLLWIRLWMVQATKLRFQVSGQLPSRALLKSWEVSSQSISLVPTALSSPICQYPAHHPRGTRHILWFGWPRTCWVSTGPNNTSWATLYKHAWARGLSNYLAECSHKHRPPTCILPDQGVSPRHCSPIASDEP